MNDTVPPADGRNPRVPHAARGALALMARRPDLQDMPLALFAPVTDEALRWNA